MTESVKDTFVSHLFELRNRLVYSLIAFGVVLVPLVTPPWFLAGKLYDLLALPMMQALPQGSKMIATGVISPFFIPLKIAMLVAFLVALPFIRRWIGRGALPTAICAGKQPRRTGAGGSRDAHVPPGSLCTSLSAPP